MRKIPLKDSDTAVLDRRVITIERRGLKKGSRPRTDVKTRAVVDKALELQDIVGTKVAAGLLANRNVPFDVAQRVLSNPRRRRKA